MDRLFKPIAAVVLVLYLIIQLLSLTFTKKSTLRMPERWIVMIAAPTQKAALAIANWFADVTNHYFFLVGTSKENERLRNENMALRRRMVELREIESENNRLRALSTLSERYPLKFVLADRIASGLSPYERTIRIRRGKQDGVIPGTAVTAPSGMIGQVWEAQERTSDVLLLVDSSSAIEVVDQRSRARGILRGEKVDLLRFEYLAKESDIKVGDEVVSSGLDGVYPAGIPVGVVAKVESVGRKLFLPAWVKPYVDFSRLEEVAIVMGGATK